MSDLLDAVVSYEPVVGAIGVPLKSDIVIVLSGVDYDETSLEEGFFVEGPSSPQYMGPGATILEYEEGIPYEDLRDILDSSYTTVPVEGTVTIVKDVNTTVTFSPTYPFQANSLHRGNLTDIKNSSEVTIDGFVSWSFTTGTGSIEELPSEISTSVLATTIQASAAVTAAAPLQILKTTPADHAVQQDPSMEEIEIVFNKAINPSSITTDSFKIEGLPVTDHPSTSITYSGDLYKFVEVIGNKIKLKI